MSGHPPHHQRRARRLRAGALALAAPTLATLAGHAGTAPPAAAEEPVCTVETQVTGARSVAGGHMHALAVMQDGTARGWGRNLAGELGDGTTSMTPYRHPVPVVGLTNAWTIAAGGGHSLAVDFSTRAWAWGSNGGGALGDGTTNDHHVPTQVPGVTGVVAVSAGFQHSVAIASPNNSVWGWGLGLDGQLGDGTTGFRYSPVQAVGLQDVAQIAAGGHHTLALRTDRTVWAWGKNTSGQIGNGTTTNQTVPVQVLTNVMEIAAGFNHSVAVKSDGTVWVWGDNSAFETGSMTGALALTPVQVPGIASVSEVVAGERFSLALKDDGTVWGWGLGSGGQLGDGRGATSASPVRVGNLTGVTAIGAGRETGYAVAGSNGALWAWGQNANGQVGDGTSVWKVRSPVAVRTACPNYLPSTPTLVSPGDGAAFSELENVEFTISATDPDGDSWTGDITITGSGGSETLAVPTTASGAEGSVSTWLPGGTYTWSAMVRDARGASSPVSGTRSFTVIPPPPSMECELDEWGAELVDATVLGVHTKVYTITTGAPPVDVCFRVDDANTGTGIGGKLTVSPRPPGVEVTGVGEPSIGAPATDDNGAACASPLNPPNQLPGVHPYVSGSVAGLVTVFADAYANGSELWLCIRAGGVATIPPDLLDLRVVVPFAPPTIGTPGLEITPYPVVTFTPDPGTPPPA